MAAARKGLSTLQLIAGNVLSAIKSVTKHCGASAKALTTG